MTEHMASVYTEIYLNVNEKKVFAHPHSLAQVGIEDHRRTYLSTSGPEGEKPKMGKGKSNKMII